MVSGWRDQQASRNLNAATLADRESALRRFQRFTGEYPWTWRPQDLEEFTAELRGGDHPAALSTIRGYQCALRLFLEYVSDLRYLWSVADWLGDATCGNATSDTFVSRADADTPSPRPNTAGRSERTMLLPIGVTPHLLGISDWASALWGRTVRAFGNPFGSCA